jgi:hypothetical protein
VILRNVRNYSPDDTVLRRSFITISEGTRVSDELSFSEMLTTFRNTSCTCVISAHVEAVKYLTNKNYSILILINIKIVLTAA